MSRLRSSKKSEEIYSGKCTNVIVNSQGGVGSSSFMRVLRKSAPYVDLNNDKDRDGLKHAPATVFRPVNGRLLFKTRHGELGCARKALIILGDPVHSIESTHRRFNASHINKWRKGSCRQAWPIAKPLAEIWSEIKTTGQDTTGLSHYVNSWLEAANRADWPVRIVDTKTLYNNATQVARYLGVRARDLQAFRKLQYTPKPYNSSAPVQVKSLFDSLHRKIEERLESWSKSRNGGDEKLWKLTGNVTQTTGTLLKAKQGALSALTDPNFKEKHTVSANVPWTGLASERASGKTTVCVEDGIHGTGGRRVRQRGMKRVCSRASAWGAPAVIFEYFYQCYSCMLMNCFLECRMCYMVYRM